eukprot:TRINITY_DN662_c0_g3_i1.p1 TRINITY_DN662_c0_g3~~TRINITY_DN662_c0_g3_i1.p1  ORF type:complete len:658 (+),score=109.63 TRINITY_DN662_c0_g3_i1:110-1975(+)
MGWVHGEDQVQTIDMYRALQLPVDRKEDFQVQNNNLADIIGVFRYVHQEIIVEHVAGDPERASRRYGIDGIARYRMKVRNPDSVLKGSHGVPQFGDFGAFDFGVSTGTQLLTDIVTDGDFVGASQQDSPQIKFTHPWYWFSVDGVCPNLPWTCIPPYAGCTKPKPPVMPTGCDPGGCAGKNDTAAKTCPSNPEFHDPTDSKTLKKCCLRYSDDPDTVVKGGLCPPGTKTPTGERGCVYAYDTLGPKDYLSIDDIVGMTDFPCGHDGERKCKNWQDWRKNCHDPDRKYHKMFDGSGNIVEASFCVEYDVHHACQETENLCNDPKCIALAPEKREVGLPFWQGKCDARANQKRAEIVAAYFLGDKVAKKHLLVDEALLKDAPQCSAVDQSAPNQCTPNPDGGPFCSRLFGGVCSTCWIPGTFVPYNLQTQPLCPYTVNKEMGNDPPQELRCKSADPVDLCCLYNLPGDNECNATIGSSGSNLELTLRGFLVSQSLQDNAEMTTFGKRWVTSLGGCVKDASSFDDMMYEHWHYQPPRNPEVAFASFRAALKNSAAVDWSGNCPPAPPPPSSSNSTGLIIAIALIAVVLLAAALFVAWRRRNRPAPAGNQPMLGDVPSGNQATNA